MFDRIDKGLWWDRAWQLNEGCSPVSEGCDHCWAAQQTHMRASNPNPKIAARHFDLTLDHYTFNGQIRLRVDNLQLPGCVKKPTTFAVWNDLFHPDVPDDFRLKALSVINSCPQHIFIICTKRHEEAAAFAPRNGLIDDLGLAPAGVCWPQNAWLMFSVENQARLTERWPHIVKCSRFAPLVALSIEPQLGPVDLLRVIEPTEWDYSEFDFQMYGDGDPVCDTCNDEGTVEAQEYYCDWINEDPGDFILCPDCERNRMWREIGVRARAFKRVIGWVVAGGETGGHARPMHPEWPGVLQRQTERAGIPFFFKSWGEFVSAKGFPSNRKIDHLFEDLYQVVRIGKKKAGRELDGQVYSQVPDLAW